MMGETRKLILPDERPVSWNKFYSGKHWTVRDREARRVHQLVRAMLDPEIPPFDGLVDIEVVAYFRNRPLDASNINAKLYEDGLVGWWILEDSA